MPNYKIFAKIILTILSAILVFSKTNGQTFTFSLQSSSLTFDYTTEAHFTVPRTIPRAFTLSINNSRIGRYNVFCKIVLNTNTITESSLQNLFGIRVNNANFGVSSSFFQVRNLNLSDVLITNVTNRRSSRDTIHYDLILNPLDLNVEPSNYNFSFVFTITEY